ncbi:MAG TPA: hypothetical protein VLB84_19435 [Bacteroidia bacterium]|nr:hypothetical protein [Bacteroidia bacterium]
MNHEKINFYTVRDFTELFNAVNKFLKQNFRHFFKTLLFIAGPFILISSIVKAFYVSRILSSASGAALNAASGQGMEFFEKYRQLMTQLGGGYFLFVLFSICANLILLTTVYSYMVVYQKQGPGNFSIAEVTQLVIKNMGKTIKGFLVLIMILLVGFIIFSIVVSMMIQLLGGGVILLLLFVILGFILIIPPLMWQFSTFFLVQIIEKSGVSESLRRIRLLMKGDFFYTWLVVFVSFLILIILSFIFLLPQYIYQMVITMGNLKGENNSLFPFTILSAVTTFLTSFIYSIFHIICGFHYCSLVEKKDGTTLMNRIEEIGNIPSADVE